MLHRTALGSETSRDFCYVGNAVQANILAAVAGGDAVNQVYNMAFAGRTTLNALFVLLRVLVAEVEPYAARVKPIYRDFQPDDVRHPLADISKVRELLSYGPAHSVRDGLAGTLAWYRGGPFELSFDRGWAPRREEGSGRYGRKTAARRFITLLLRAYRQTLGRDRVRNPGLRFPNIWPSRLPRPDK
ncbi:MAG: UDP-N-acetylglucosaminuronic acid 4-epimerase [uncultured Rubrobacteraceae bacterium]|uniref:UDP-N-acetylglucosaminuronic acid 4-epimerase n=1 Tax=uncultured Rubrobacteraceae bacterium TaxID=349277 RepID=A0A6J4QE03_9ACTN|nr:MAG: UDP-N-acetylglucosaminuronic acid 4-epimerase [uncultured Rubrobacteraceae bacterium]